MNTKQCNIVANIYFDCITGCITFVIQNDLVMATKISRLDFEFTFSGHGHYVVVYTSPKTGKKWRNITNNMPLIDATKNADTPKVVDLNRLKAMCKS